MLLSIKIACAGLNNWPHEEIFNRPQYSIVSMSLIWNWQVLGGWNYDHMKSGIRNRYYSKNCVKRPLSKRPKISFQEQLSLNTDKKNCRMLQGDFSAILSNFIKLPVAIKIFTLSLFEWPFYTGFTVITKRQAHAQSSLRYLHKVRT